MPDPGSDPEEKRVTPADRRRPPSASSAWPKAESYPVAGTDGAIRDPVAVPRSYPGAELIGAGTAQEILARILVGDPLGIVDRARGWLDAHAYLLDSNRLALRTMAHVARSARRYRGKPDLHSFIELLLGRATSELINEDREADRLGRPVHEDEIAPYAFLSEALGIDPSLARRACSIVNGMVEYDRRVFYATAIQGKSIQRHVSEGHGPPARAEAALQRVLRRLIAIDGMTGGPHDHADLRRELRRVAA
ncbi:MAG: hypothetical protein IPK67_05820 [Planctomycetes bacterium]|nr:hypothetical protein [Planctomycetota bacterium]